MNHNFNIFPNTTFMPLMSLILVNSGTFLVRLSVGLLAKHYYFTTLCHFKRQFLIVLKNMAQVLFGPF